MSMSMHVVGIRAADQKWRLMKQIYEACRTADVEIPREVQTFFGDTAPDIRGVKVELVCNAMNGPVTTWSESGLEMKGFEVELAKLPKDITHIRFYNSW